VINSADDSDDDEEESYPGASIREVEDVKNLQIFAVAAQQKAYEAAKKLTEKAKTHNTRGKGKAPVNQASSKNTPAPAANASAPNAPVPMGQFKYQTSAKNPKILTRVMEKFLHGEVTLTTKEMLAASSELRKHMRDIVTPRKVTAGTNLYNAGASNSVSVNVAELKPRSDGLISTDHSVSLRALDVKPKDGFTAEAIVDDGSQIIAVRRNIWEKSGESLRADYKMVMESANTTSNDTMGLIPDFKINIGGYDFYIQAQVVEKAPYEILLGRPFFVMTRVLIQHFEDEGSHMTMTDPNTKAIISVPTKE